MLFGNLRRRKSRIHYLTTLKGAVGMLRDPNHTESVFDIEDGLRDIEATSPLLENHSQKNIPPSLMEGRVLF